MKEELIKERIRTLVSFADKPTEAQILYVISCVERLLKAQNQDLLEEMIKLSDDIEAKYGTPDINEWRAFKHFRNTMRDKLKSIRRH